MRIGLYHGYELTGSGSNEYTRYLSRSLAQLGHEVHVLCREPDPAAVDHVAEAFEWSREGVSRSVVSRRSPTPGRCVVHCLPHASVRPVFLTDRQRPGNVKAFVDLTDDELREVHDVNVAAVRRSCTPIPWTCSTPITWSTSRWRRWRPLATWTFRW